MTGSEVAMVVLGILVTIGLGMSGWALLEIVGLKVKLAASNATAAAHKEEIERRFKEKDDSIKAMVDQFNGTVSKLENNVMKEVNKIEGQVVAVHNRLDVILTQNRT